MTSKTLLMGVIGFSILGLVPAQAEACGLFRRCRTSRPAQYCYPAPYGQAQGYYYVTPGYTYQYPSAGGGYPMASGEAGPQPADTNAPARLKALETNIQILNEGKVTKPGATVKLVEPEQ